MCCAMCPMTRPARSRRRMLGASSTSGAPAANPFAEIPNRGKRGITIDLASESGRALLLELAATSDVFLTSYLPAVRQKLGIDVEDLRAANPNIIYVRGHGWGAKGPMQ